MARYFQAPVLQPVDYGYQAPFQQIYGAMQMEQQKYDKGEEAALNLYTFEQLNALKQDYGKRNKLVQNRYDEVDALLYDENGNRRDMRNIMPSVKQIAKRRAAEEQSGGEWNQIKTNFDQSEVYVKELQDQYEKGHISKDRRDFLESYSLNVEYKGIGEKQGQFGALNPFRGVSAAKEYNDQQVAFDYVKDQAFNQLQSAGIFDKQGNIIATQETIDNAVKTHFKDVGDFIQTGTVEFRTLELLKHVGMKSLYQDSELRADIMQEAFQYGLKNPTQIEEYYHKKLDELSTTAAEKYASAKFSPQIREDWRVQKNYQHGLDKALIDYEKTKEMNVLEFDNNNQVYTLDPKAAINALDSTKTAINAQKDYIKNTFYTKDGKPRPDLTGLELEQLKEADYKLANLRRQEWTYQQQNNQMGQVLVKKDGGNYMFEKVATTLMGKLSGYSPEGMKGKEGTLALQSYLKDNFSPEELFEMSTNGTLFKNKDLIAQAKDSWLQSGSPWNNGYFGRNERIKNSEALKDGTYTGTDLKESLMGELKTEAEKGNLKFEFVTTSRTAEGADNFTAEFNKNLNKMVELGAAGLETVQGEPYNIYSHIAKMFPGYETITDISTMDVGQNHPGDDGTPMMTVTAKVKDKKGKVQQYSMTIGAPGGTQTSYNIKANKARGGVQTIKAATADPSKTSATEKLERGAHDIGTVRFSGTGLDRAQYLNVGETQIISDPGSTVPQLFVKKVNEGYVVAEPTIVNGTYSEPDWGDTNNLIFDERTWTQQKGKPKQYIFKSLSDIKQNVGWQLYNSGEVNKYYNPSNYK